MGRPEFEIIIDQAFLDGFFVQKDDPIGPDPEEVFDLYRDIWRFIRKSTTYARYLTDFDSFESFSKAVTENPFLEQLIQYGPPEMKFDAFADPKVLDSILESDEYCLKIFFLDDLQEPEKVQIQSYGYLNISTEDIAQKWLPFSKIWEYSKIGISSNLSTFPKGHNLIDWSIIKTVQHPLHSAIIHDHYLFSGAPYLNNLLPMMKDLFSLGPISKEFNLTIITDKNIEIEGVKGIKECQKRIKEDLLKEFNFSNITILLHKIDIAKFQEANGGEKNIDRWILTNYFLIDAGHGFNIFDSKKNIARTSYLSFQFVLRQPELAYSNHLRSTLRKYFKLKGMALPRLLK